MLRTLPLAARALRALNASESPLRRAARRPFAAMAVPSPLASFGAGALPDATWQQSMLRVKVRAERLRARPAHLRR